MTRKDYVLIAKAIREAREESADVDYVDSSLIVANLVIALRNDNPRFDAGRFIMACAGK